MRLTGVAKNTITKMLIQVADACTKYQDRVFRNLLCEKIQCDEIWSFCYGKSKNVPADKQGIFGSGDVWTWTALCADTKLIASWRIGARGAETAFEFMHDLAGRLAHRVRLTTDGHRVYLDAVESAFGSEIDHAMLIKLYGADREGSESRHSPAECIGRRAIPTSGNRKARHISASFVERQNLTMRMSMRRFTRPTNSFRKKIENHTAAVALYFMYYNFCRIHQALRVTPAMEARVTDHVWSVEEMVALLDGNSN